LRVGQHLRIAIWQFRFDALYLHGVDPVQLAQA
jgi:hypothetical protein